jgi:hypothetical protein
MKSAGFVTRRKVVNAMLGAAREGIHDGR